MKIYEKKGIKYRLPNELTDFQLKIYIHLINWKWKNISKEAGKYCNTFYDALIPKKLEPKKFPLYQPIIETFKSHQKNFPFKSHTFIGHMASSQAACANLFLPILQDSHVAAKILSSVKSDLKSIATATEYFDKGFRIEFWDKPDNMLNDHNKATGTDSDIAIAYYDYEDNLNLWLIEHKLSEKEFTTCGGAKSKGRKKCHSCKSISDILNNKKLCYYHSAKNYQYWKITEQNTHIFNTKNLLSYKYCPFKGGMNQLWRNQLLGLEIENSQSPRWQFKKVYFSVVYHPKNESLKETLTEYEELISYNNRFFHFTSDKIINAANLIDDKKIKDWINWYMDLYYF